MKCQRCGEQLKFETGKGWVHQDGKIYKARKMTQEEIPRFINRYNREPKNSELLIDDHCVLPIPD